MCKFLIALLCVAPVAFANTGGDAPPVGLAQFHDEASLLVAKGYRAFRHQLRDAETRKTIEDFILVRDPNNDPIYRYSSVTTHLARGLSRCVHSSRGRLRGSTVQVDEYQLDSGCVIEAGLRQYTLQWIREHGRWGSDVVAVTLQTPERTSRLDLDRGYVVFVGKVERDGKWVRERISWHLSTPDKVMRYTVLATGQTSTDIECESLTVSYFYAPDRSPFELQLSSAQVRGGHVFCTARDTAVRSPLPRCLGVDNVSPRCGGGDGMVDLSAHYYYSLRPAANHWQRTLITAGTELILQVPVYTY